MKPNTYPSSTFGSRFLVLAMLLVLAVTAVTAQHPRRQLPVPPEPADPQANAQSSPQEVSPKIHTNAAHLQHEFEELSDLIQNLQRDIDSVNRGLLPKDTVSKLKRIEKLARQLRREIAP